MLDQSENSADTIAERERVIDLAACEQIKTAIGDASVFDAGELMDAAGIELTARNVRRVSKILRGLGWSKRRERKPVEMGGGLVYAWRKIGTAGAASFMRDDKGWERSEK